MHVLLLRRLLEMLCGNAKIKEIAGTCVVHIRQQSDFLDFRDTFVLSEAITVSDFSNETILRGKVIHFCV